MDTVVAKRKPQRKRVNAHMLQAGRKAKGFTQAALAAKADVDHTTMSRVERGERYSLPVDVIAKVAEALDLPPTALYAAES